MLCPLFTCVCMCAVNSGGCVIDLLVQGWASTSALLCLVTGNNANTDNSPVPSSPFCIPPYLSLGDGRREMKNHLRYSHTFPTNRPTGNRTLVGSVISKSVTTRPPAIKLGRHVNYGKRMDPIDFRGQRSWSQWARMEISCEPNTD